MIARSFCLANRLNLIGHSVNKLNYSIPVQASVTRCLNKANLHSAALSRTSTPTFTLANQSRQLACGGILSTNRFFHSKNPNDPTGKDGEQPVKKINITSTPKSILGDDLKNIMQSQVVIEENNQAPKKASPAPDAAEAPAGIEQHKSRFERIVSI